MLNFPLWQLPKTNWGFELEWNNTRDTNYQYMRVGRRVAECSSAFDQYLKLIWDDLWTLWVQFLNAMNHVFYQSMAHQGSNAMIFACYDDVSRLQSNGNDGSNENHDDEDEAIRKIEIAN